MDAVVHPQAELHAGREEGPGALPGALDGRAVDLQSHVQHPFVDLQLHLHLETHVRQCLESGVTDRSLSQDVRALEARIAAVETKVREIGRSIDAVLERVDRAEATGRSRAR